jgi:hypothetical protein
MPTAISVIYAFGPLTHRPYRTSQILGLSKNRAKRQTGLPGAL